MTSEKLQLIATTKVSSKHKERWLRWWNMSKESRKEYNFPPSPASDSVLRIWIDQAAFWAGYVILNRIFVFFMKFKLYLKFEN